MSGKDVKREAYDRMVERIVKNSGASVAQAEKIARESAERINRKRKDGDR